jgi:hypothetical protein
VHAADHILCGFRFIILDERSINAGLQKFFPAEGFEKISPVILKNLGFDDEQALDLCFYNFHGYIRMLLFPESVS